MKNTWLRGAARTGAVVSCVASALVWIACSQSDHPSEGGEYSGDDTTNPNGGQDGGTHVQTKADAAATDAGDGGVSCTSQDAAAELAVCANQCVDLKTDRNNCGGCGEPCGDAGLTCVNGSCQCASPAVMCGQCVDITRDPNNCGYCGHSCQGNGCANSTCAPANIAAVTNNQAIISSLAVDGVNIYWTQGTAYAGAFLKPFSGGGTRQLGGGADPRGIAVDPNYVYWIHFQTGAIQRWPINGGNTLLLLGDYSDAGAEPGSVGVQVDAHNIYWTDSLLGTVNQLALPTDANPKTISRDDPSIVTIASGQASPRALVIDANNVYWINYGSGTGSVNQAAKGSTNSVVQLAPSESLPTGLAVDQYNVYWTDANNDITGTVKSVPIGGGNISTIAQNQGAPTGVAVDQVEDAGQPFVYWTSYDNDAVLKAPIDGGTTFPLASMLNNPSAILVDSKSVYWANKGNGQISKVIK